MSEFLTDVDIANRALQHVGSQMIDNTIGFAENSIRAQQTSFAYGKLRRAELRRNSWRFATRKAALRPIDSNTLMLAPSLWVSTTTYFKGSIVADENNNLWSSLIPNNTGNHPLTSSMWEAYFGPMTVQLYDSTQQYYSGELTYTAAGDGTYNTFRSLASVNAVHPALPNQWSTIGVYSKNQVVQQFPAWSSLTTYTQGQSVSFTDGNIYSSLTNGNTNNNPASSVANWSHMPVLTLTAQPVSSAAMVTGPQSSPIVEWSQVSTYQLGSFVMFNSSVYLSISANNTGNFPNATASTKWKVTSGSILYMSLFDLNYGNDPATTFIAEWAIGTTYVIGNSVTGSDGVKYTSLSNGNLGFDPTTDGGVHWTYTGIMSPWDTSFIQGYGNSLWLQIGGARFPTGVGLATPSIIYPVDSGPVEQGSTRNVYRLPNGYLRTASQDPKAGSVSYLGAPGGLPYRDWEFEGDYFVTRETQPIVFRFIADLSDVKAFDDMFCEGLAARIGLEVCEPLTQSTAKLQAITAAYNKFMTDARVCNAIEIGAEEPPMDDYISARW